MNRSATRFVLALVAVAAVGLTTAQAQEGEDPQPPIQLDDGDLPPMPEDDPALPPLDDDNLPPMPEDEDEPLPPVDDEPEEELDDAGDDLDEPDASEDEDEAEQPAVEEVDPEPRPRAGKTLADDPGWISDEVRPPDREGVPGVRPAPMLEFGDPFLGQGEINRGIEIPLGGAIWNPSLLIYGTVRSTVYGYQDGIDNTTLQNNHLGNGRSFAHARREAQSPVIDWANRIDIFANLRLSATERILIGWRPLEDPDQFGATGYYFQPNDDPNTYSNDPGWVQSWDGEIQALFFEGDLGEILPDLDPTDTHLLDIGFSVGRQRISFQDGVMINSRMDAVAITRNSLRFIPGTNNIRITALYGLPDAVNQNRFNRRDHLGLFTETDTGWSTIEIDFMYVNSRDNSGSGVFFGAAFTQRIGKLNSTFRYNVSQHLGRSTQIVEDGQLFIAELSLDMPGGALGTLIPDILYLNAFVGVDRYRSALRDRDAATPLARVGFLYAGRAIGRYGNPLGSQHRGATGNGNALIDADRSIGFALGYQMFLSDDARHQLAFELAMRRSTANKVRNGAAAFGVRYQVALGKHIVLLGEGFGGIQESRDPEISMWGARTEVVFKF